MKPPSSFLIRLLSQFLGVGLAAALALPVMGAEAPTGPKAEPPLADGELEPVGNAILTLLTTRDAGAFSRNYAPSSNDWNSLVTTNLSPDKVAHLLRYAKATGHSLKNLKEEAEVLIKRSESLHLKFSGDDWHTRVFGPKSPGSAYLLGFSEKRATLPYVTSLDVVLYRGDEASVTTNDSYKITVRGLTKFPEGWRINSGRNDVQWSGVPTNATDTATLREIALTQKISSSQPITSEDEPALGILATNLLRFARDKDTNWFKQKVLLSGDDVWGVYEKSGRKGPSRPEVDEEIAKQSTEELVTADKVLRQMEVAGVDLQKAEVQIKEASVERCQGQGGAGASEVLNGSQFNVVLVVKTSARAAGGGSLQGDYVLAAKEVMRLNGVWKLSGQLRWVKFPVGVLDSKTEADIRFENYVAEHRALPPGTAAPEIEFTTLAGKEKMKLSDFKGKVVVLDFWATWCGACQEPMAELQKVKAGHPDWGDKVMVIPVSIDDTLTIAREHVERRGWTNTFNVWAGEGGWHATTAKAFRVSAVPTSYVLDPKGAVVWSGHPMENTITYQVQQLLNRP